MINGKRVLAVIPARGGSKGIPHKNIVDLNGKPLIAYTIEAALQCKYVDRVVVSTDDDEIAEVSKRFGADVPFIRPAYLSTDTAKSIDALLHAVEFCEQREGVYDIVTLLQATSPFRDAKDLSGALEMYESSGNKSIVSVHVASENPILLRQRDEQGNVYPILNAPSTVRRQEMETYYTVNGAFYINSREQLTQDVSLNDNDIGYVISRRHGIDIDDVDDLEYARWTGLKYIRDKVK